MKDGISLADQVVAELRRLFPNGAALHEPYFKGNEEQYVVDCIRTGWVSSVGSYVDRMERMLEEITGARRAVVVANGTVAIEVALTVLGVQADDEVLVPALTFVATANAVTHAGGVPHFIDIAEATLGVDPESLSSYLQEIAEVRDGSCWNKTTGRRIFGVIPVHIFGCPVQMEPLLELAARYHLHVVEDAAEGLGSYWNGRHLGTFGEIGILSFNGNKIITTGGGGALLVDNDQLSRRLKHLTTTAKVSHPWRYFHDEVGYNYRLTNLAAALGCAQLEQLDSFLERKRRIHRKYQEVFNSVDGVTVFHGPEGARSNNWLNALLVEQSSSDELLKILNGCHANGIMVRPAWELMNRLPMYASNPRMSLDVSENMVKRILNLPSSVFLDEKL